MNNTLQVCVNGKPVKQYSHHGKVFIEARNGTEYTIKIYNGHWQRRLAVVTVDGINVVSGKPQGNETGQGYIIQPWSTLDIKGFRKDLSSVGAFKFCNKTKSYGNSQGAEGNNGVIGVRLYEEKPIIRYAKSTFTYDSSSDNNSFPIGSPFICCSSLDSPLRSCCPSSSSCSSDCNTADSAPQFELGTTWGKKVDDSVTMTDFDSEDKFGEERILYYDTRKNLEAIGVRFEDEKNVNSFPQAFGGFAKPPEGWRG